MEPKVQHDLREVMRKQGETPADLIACFYQPRPSASTSPVRCAFEELPDFRPVIAYSPRYAYITGIYDGATWLESIPRHPDDVTDVPEVGG